MASHRVFRRPYERLELLSRRLDELELAADRALRTRLRQSKQGLDALAAQLDSLSPLAVLSRGYSLTHRLSDARLIRDAADLSPGDLLQTRFAQGRAVSRVERLE
jgi:exodeoxyribonuclease VII large subunit